MNAGNRVKGRCRWRTACQVWLWMALAAATVCARRMEASENEAHRPFAFWADLPRPGQFIVGAVYEESEAYHIFAHKQQVDVTYHSGGEKYGIDINQGYFSIQYGVSDRWAVDLNVGGTTAGWRSFDDGRIQKTTGLMDFTFGVRYQILKEGENDCPFVPTLTARFGAILPGTYDEDLAFAPGTRSAAIEPELLMRKHFGWPGLGVYADGLFRWNRTTANDQYLTVIGLFQQIQRWELDAGWRHLQSVAGEDISIDSSDLSTLSYPRAVREINDSIEAGFSYRTSKRGIRFGFHSRTVFDGNNTDRKFWVGGSVDVPLGGAMD